MKRIICTVVSLLILVSFSGCGSKKISEEEFNKMTPIADNKISDLYGDPESFAGERFDFTGSVLSVETKDGTTYLHVWQDPTNYEHNTIVVYEGDLVVAEDDYVKISGIVEGEYKGQNAFGGTVSAPRVIARSCEVIDYMQAVAPATATIEVNQSQDQNGVVITIQKVEFSKIETRVYVTVKNNSAYTASYYAFNSVITQGSNQYDEETNYEYDDFDGTILSGIEISGIVTFPVIDAQNGPINIQMEAYSDNWRLDFNPYVFANIQ